MLPCLVVTSALFIGGISWLKLNKMAAIINELNQIIKLNLSKSKYVWLWQVHSLLEAFSWLKLNEKAATINELNQKIKLDLSKSKYVWLWQVHPLLEAFSWLNLNKKAATCTMPTYPCFTLPVRNQYKIMEKGRLS